MLMLLLHYCRQVEKNEKRKNIIAEPKELIIQEGERI